MIIKIAVTAIVGVILLLLLKRTTAGFSVIFEILLVLLIVLSVMPEINELISTLDNFSFAVDINDTAIKTMLKAISILILGSISSDICRDNGENALAGVVELSVKLLAISCALPVFSAVIALAAAFFT
ncbi:MAG: SpoIIIAC/SpoIIIAD family protein [Acutalibacteraceae bacterium]